LLYFDFWTILVHGSFNDSSYFVHVNINIFIKILTHTTSGPPVLPQGQEGTRARARANQFNKNIKQSCLVLPIIFFVWRENAAANFSLLGTTPFCALDRILRLMAAGLGYEVVAVQVCISWSKCYTRSSGLTGWNEKINLPFSANGNDWISSKTTGYLFVCILFCFCFPKH